MIQRPSKGFSARDAIGWGYSLFLPWGTYKPEINQIHLKICYQPPKGYPIYAVGTPITLTDPEQMKTMATGLAARNAEDQSADGGYPLQVSYQSPQRRVDRVRRLGGTP